MHADNHQESYTNTAVNQYQLFSKIHTSKMFCMQLVQQAWTPLCALPVVKKSCLNHEYAMIISSNMNF